jgi:urocanate hydratase
VNSVDEALRILKNEIRKHKPVSVALANEENSAFEELAERGVAPEIFVVRTGQDAGPPGGRFSALATRVLQTEEAERLLGEYMRSRALRVQEFGFSSAQELSAFDHGLTTAMPEGDLRKRWALAAPGFFYRDRPFRRMAAVRAGEIFAG